MPVQKFRTFDDASRALATATPGGVDSLEARIARLWSFSAALVTPLDFRGVRKYRSIAEADEDRRRMTIARPHRTSR